MSRSSRSTHRSNSSGWKHGPYVWKVKDTASTVTTRSGFTTGDPFPTEFLSDESWESSGRTDPESPPESETESETGEAEEVEMAHVADPDPEIGSLTAHLDGEPAQAIVMNPRQRSIEIKTNVLGVLPTFSGRRSECPYEFLNEFSKLCSIQKRPNDATEEDFRLRAIPFTLKGEANTWLLRLPPDSIRTWRDFKLEFLDYFFPSNKTNALKKEIVECKQDYDESLSQYWARFKGLLDACPNHRMIEAETYSLFYEGATPESKDLMNSSSGGNFTRKRGSEAREILGKLIDAKKAYDNPRNTVRRGSANALREQEDDKVEARIDRLEKALLNAIEKTNTAAPKETAKLLGPGDNQLQQYYGPQEGDYQAQANAMGCWNPDGSWNPGRQRDAPWRNHPNFRWSENEQSQPAPQLSIQSAPQPERQGNWRNHEGQGNWNNRNQGDHSTWGNKNQNYQGSSYVPPHQRNFQTPYPGQGSHFNNNPGGQGNIRPAQGSGTNQNVGPGPSQPSSRPRNLDEMVHDLVSSQQHIQNNLQSNNDVVHKLQDAQQEQKAAMDMLAKQLSQIATSLSDMRGNEGKIPASVRPPDRANISQITLRSGKEYEGPVMRYREATTPVKDKGTEDTITGSRNSVENNPVIRDELQAGDLEEPLPKAAEPFFLDPEPELGGEKKVDESSTGESSGTGKRQKPFPNRGEAKKKKDEPVDLMDIFGKLEINLPFLQALKMPVFSKFIKEFIAGKARPSGKILIGENVSAVIQKRRMPSKCNDPGMFTLPISIGDVKIEHAMCDLGASINVLPLSIYKKLVGVGMVDTKVVIQLADRSCICPEGVLENVIVKVHDFLYPADFHVIKMSDNESVESGGVLLGRPFLRTAKTIIDVFDGTICLDYNGEKYTFSIDEAMKKPLDVENLHSIDVINPLVQEYLETELMQGQIENSEMSHAVDREVASWCQAMNTSELSDEELAEAILEFCTKPELARSRETLYVASKEDLPGSTKGMTTGAAEKNPLPQEKDVPKKELKTLPPGLKYAYLEENETFPVIINSNLTKEQEEELLKVI